MKIIKLTKDKETLIDDEDLELRRFQRSSSVFQGIVLDFQSITRVGVGMEGGVYNLSRKTTLEDLYSLFLEHVKILNERESLRQRIKNKTHDT